MNTTTLILPVVGKPADVLINANQRLHWAPKAKRTEHWREMGRITAVSAMNRGQLVKAERALIEAWFVWPDLRRRDPHNWSPTVKAIVDGIVDSGFLVDDDFRHLDGPDLRQWPEKGPCAIRLDVTVIERRAA